ncbi:MAG: Metalloenzyme, LuxS/M16 peptidase-like protein, partial [Olpidium bornovanus]
DSRSSTALATAREAEIRGAVLSASLTREHLFLTADPYFVEVLREAAYGTKFNVYEGGSVGYLVSLETSRAIRDPEIAVNESLHRVAFRNGLGNSLFAPSQSKLDLSTVKGFGLRQSSFSDKVALVASGVDLSELERLARDLLSPDQVGLTKSSEATQASKYFGGERRVDAPSDETGHLAIGYPSGAFGSAADCAAHVLKAYLGGWNSACDGTSPLGKVAAATGACFQPFAYSYSDAGLFGVRIQSAYDKAQSAASAVVSEIRKAAEGIPEAEFARSVATAKVAILSALENRVSLVECLGAQVLSGKVTGPIELAGKLDTLKAADVSKFAATMLKSKPSVVAYGNTMALPYADSL